MKFLLSLLLTSLATLAYADTSTISMSTHEYAKGLSLDFYSDAIVDMERPLILLVHGGGFSGGHRDGPLEAQFAKKMATKGYAIASMSYRLTRSGKAEGFGCHCATEDKLNTFVAASEDIALALHMLIENEEFVFDRDKIILMGSSAGAEAILNSAYMNRHHLFRHIPNYEIAGVISLAGAVLDERYMDSSNAVPGLFIHGRQDNIVPYDSAPHHFCDKSTAGYLMLDGSRAISLKLEELGESYILAYAPNGNHDWAGYGYGNTDLVTYFIEEVIIEKKRLQQRIELKREN